MKALLPIFLLFISVPAMAACEYVIKYIDYDGKPVEIRLTVTDGAELINTMMPPDFKGGVTERVCDSGGN